MLHNGLKSMLRSNHHEGCCYAVTFNYMGKKLPGLQILLRSSRQGPIDHFTVVGFVTWFLNLDGNEAGVDLVLRQTSLLFLCKLSCSYAN